MPSLVAMRTLPPLLVALVSGCGSSSSGNHASDASASTSDGAADGAPSDDGGPPSDAAILDASCDREVDASLYYQVVRLDNALCLPIALPCSCRILFDGVTGACGQPGLATASLDDQAALLKLARDHDASLPAGSICELDQLAASATPGAGCADDTAAGWCFVQGSCPSDASPQCTQAACTTSGFTAAHVAYASAYLVCP
jgi:hypothetical protein